MSARVRIISDFEEACSPVFRAAWNALLDQRGGEPLFYQTPGYFDHLTNTRDRASVFLAVIEDARRAIVGIVPLALADATLDLQVRGRELAKLSFSTIRIFPGTPLLPSSPELLGLFFEHLSRIFQDHDSIQLSSVPTGSALWRFVERSPEIRESFLVYTPNGRRQCHVASIPDNLEAYLSAFGRKKRYNLKRQMRRLQEYSGGELTLRRIQTVDGVASLRQAMSQLGIASDSTLTSSAMRDLARRGMLLSYVMGAGEKTYAVAVGTRCGDTLLFHRFAHDESIGHLSPGAVLHLSMMEDLIDNRLARRIDYGFGEPKYRLNNVVDERVAVMLFRRTLPNRARILAHSAFERTLEAIKGLAERRPRRPTLVPQGVTSADL
jgi:CelD/BcsL family acetyltransferase involved in cellulose biosynthesis